MCQQSKLLNLSSNTFVAMSHPFVDFEHLPQVFDGVTRHIGRTLGWNSTVYVVKDIYYNPTAHYIVLHNLP